MSGVCTGKSPSQESLVLQAVYKSLGGQSYHLDLCFPCWEKKYQVLLKFAFKCVMDRKPRLLREIGESKSAELSITSDERT